MTGVKHTDIAAGAACFTAAKPCSPMRVATPMNLEDRILVDPAVRNGKPCIRGTRITVYDVLEYLAGGMSEAELLQDFPKPQR